MSFAAFQQCQTILNLPLNPKQTLCRRSSYREPATANLNTKSPTKTRVSLPTYTKIAEAASLWDIRLDNQSFGPLVRIQAYSQSSGNFIGYINGYILFQRLTIEAYKAFNRNQQSSKEVGSVSGEKGGLIRVTSGILLFLAAIAFGWQQGCKKVYGLAIRDADEQHRRLVSYLKRWGGEDVGKVGNKVGDIGKRLLYGGEGTIICADIEKMLLRGGRLLKINKDN